MRQVGAIFERQKYDLYISSQSKGGGMPKTNFTKIKLLKLWEILSRDSNEDHPLSTSENIEELKNKGVCRRHCASEIASR